MTKAKIAAEGMAEGDVLVRGTTDPVAALAALVADEDTWLGPDNQTVDALHAHVMVLLNGAMTGYWRKVHCLPNSYGAFEGWGWTLHGADGPGRGAFQGVYFRA
jgi:hypothetical protein